MNCESDFQPSEDIPENAYILLFYNDEILVTERNGMIHIPSRSDINGLNIQITAMQHCGSLHGNAYYGGNICRKDILPGFSLKKLRQLAEDIAEEFVGIAFRGFHIINWLKTNKFCGCCGGVMQVMAQPQELAAKCLSCDHIVYPRISPAIIVAVVKEHEILLARSNRLPPGRYSVIAGFVEPGETLEDCVRRELQEEVGVEVDHIEYFGNQPWPFPDSLMVAFTAQYAKGELTIDNNEIVAADWFSADALPDIPGKGSIARRLIDWFLEKQSKTLQV